MSARVSTVHTEDEKQRFIISVTIDFCTAVDDAELSLEGHDTFGDINWVKLHMKEWLERWLSTSVTVSSDWVTTSRFLNVLRQGFNEKKIAFDTLDDYFAFKRFLFSDSEDLPELVGHYVETGEFMELAYLVKQEFDASLLKDEKESATWARVRAAMLRLYEFDQRLDVTSLHLPLDVRTMFIGFFDDEEKER